MSRFTLAYAPATDFPSPFLVPSTKETFNKRADSHSGSEDDCSYVHYHHTREIDTDPEGPPAQETLSRASTLHPEDPNAALTSQTLNADGTPKRPMNAFMIFARRRRPQVSTQNQSMRTGEISKILSREWSSMGTVEKQFYLDQAKLLKETFNSKYPDYVYRRRPNNSRKKRRTEGGVTRTLDNPNPSDLELDVSGSEILGDSPIEDPAFMDNAVDVQFPHDPSPTFSEHRFAPQSRGSPYYAASEISHTVEPPDNRVPYISSVHERASHLPSTSFASARVIESHFPFISPNQSHSQVPSHYSAEQNAGQSNWESGGDKGRVVPSNYNDHCSDEPKNRSYSSSSSSSPHSAPLSWQTAGPAAQINTSNTAACHGSNYPFPTLNSPFFPNPPNLDGNFSHSSPSPSPAQSGTSSHYITSQNHLHGSASQSRPVSQYDNRSYTSSPSIRNINGYALDSDRDSHLYQHPHPRSALPQPLPPPQPISPFPQTTSLAPLISSQLGFWSRDSKLDG